MVTDNHVGRMKARMRADLVKAMKARRAEETALLRTLLAAIDNAEAPAIDHRVRPISGASSEIERLVLTAAELEAVLLREARDCEQAAAELAGSGHGERADALRRQAGIAKRYIERIAE
jgi:hypothetical protein